MENKQKTNKLKITACISVTLLVIIVVLWLLQCLLMPKYMSEIKEGALISEYYNETTSHDVIFVGDCEVYENISPITLWTEYGITSYIRGSAQQLIWQSYYILEDTFNHEKPDIVIYNVQSMIYGQPQSEAYNRMTLDGLKMSSSKINAIKASMTEDESFLSYIFPIFRYHSRWSDLSKEDIKYIFDRDVISHNGYLMQTAVRPMESLPAVKPLEDYTLPSISFEYLDKMAKLCKDNGAELVLVKSPSLYPHWYEEWDLQVAEYAKSNNLTYRNFIKESDEIGIDMQTDTYDMGMHLNVYGAEKYTSYLGKFLTEKYASSDIFNHSQEKSLNEIWANKVKKYQEDKKKSEVTPDPDINIKPDDKYNEHPHNGFYFNASEVKIGVNCGAWLVEEIKKAGLEYSYYEAQSCAYQGMDMFYTFDSFEVMVNTIDGHNVITTISILDDLVKTAEGLKIGDSFEKLTELYGNDYTVNGNIYKFTKDGTALSILIKNNKVNSIEYIID